MIRLLPLLVIVGVSACSKDTPAAAASAATPVATQAAAAPPKPVPAELPDVLARVNGETITKAEFQNALANIEERAGAPVPNEQRDQVYRGVLEQLIGLRLLEQEARAKSINVPDADIDARLEAIKQHFGAPGDFDKALAAQQMTMATLREQTRSDIRVQKLIEAEVDSKITVQPKDVDDFYQKNPEQFKQEERVRAHHILITVAADAEPKVKEAARVKAASILKQVRSGGDFQKLAQEHSQDPGTAPRGGDLGFFNRGQMVGAFERAAFALKPSEVSDLVETPFGFHIIKVAEQMPSKTMTLEEVRPQLEQFLKDRQRQERTEALVASLKTRGKVEVLI